MIFYYYREWRSNQIELNDDVKSYKTKENLVKAIERYNLNRIRHVICKTENDRWTAVFLVSEYVNREGGYVGIASQHGFMSV